MWAAFVVLLVDCWGNVVSIVRILWSWTYLHVDEVSWVGAVVGKFGYHWIFRQCRFNSRLNFGRKLYRAQVEAFMSEWHALLHYMGYFMVMSFIPVSERGS